MEPILLRMSVAATVVIVVALTVTAVLRKRSPAERHIVWSSACLVCLSIPAVAAFGFGPRLGLLPPTMRATPTRVDSGEGVALPAAVTNATHLARRASAATARGAGGVATGAVLVYWLGVVGVLSSLGIAGFRVRRLIRRTSSADTLGSASGVPVPRHVVLRSGCGIASPFVIGVLRPTIVMPDDARSWPSESLRNALTHELAHVRRHDWFIQTLALVACALHWFNPLLWLARRRLVLEAERACDEVVLSTGGDALSYAQQLVTIQRAASRAPQFGVTMSRGQLPRRIHAILNRNTRRRPMTRTRTFLTTAASLAALGLLSSVRLTTAAVPHESSAVRVPTTPLLRAAAGGDVASVLAALDAGADVNAVEPGLGNALIVAARGGHVDVVDLLLTRGADASRADVSRPRVGDVARTPLGAAAQAGAADVVERLVSAGADVEWAPRGDATPLMIAVKSGSLPVVSWLLDHGADPNRTLVGDGTALIVASRTGDASIAERLLASGADPNRFVPGDECPLFHAIDRGDAAMVQALIRSGVDVQARIDGEGLPLSIAVDRGNRAVIEALLAAGASFTRGAR